MATEKKKAGPRAATRAATKSNSRKKITKSPEIQSPFSSSAIKKLEKGARLASARVHNQIAKQKSG